LFYAVLFKFFFLYSDVYDFIINNVEPSKFDLRPLAYLHVHCMTVAGCPTAVVSAYLHT